MKATVRRQGVKTEVEDKHASFAIDGKGDVAHGRFLVMGKDLSVSVEVPSDGLEAMWTVLNKHFSGRR